MFLCKCDCGNMAFVRAFSYTKGLKKSCGCYQKESAIKASTKHGMSYSRIRGSYNQMKQRCDNPKNQDYKNYGGRGITYCEKWSTFSGFLDDMLVSYTNGLTIDRIDVNGNYCRDNCRWIPMADQAKNKRKSIKVIINGDVYSLKEIAEKCGVKYHYLWTKVIKQNKPLLPFLKNAVL